MSKATELMKRYNEVKPGRIWDGKSKKLKSLMTYMHDNGIMSQSEMDEMDEIFGLYTRYWSGMVMDKPYNDKSDEEVAILLEQRVEDFMKKVLAKYWTKTTKKKFRFDQLLKELKEIKAAIDKEDSHELTTWWNTKAKVNSEFHTLLAIIGKQLAALDPKVDKAVQEAPWYRVVGIEKRDIPTKNNTLSYKRSMLTKAGSWPKKLESKHRVMIDNIKKLGLILDNVIYAVDMAKKELG